MQILLTPTGRFEHLDGHRVQVWEGVTEEGNHCTVYVTAIVPGPGDDAAMMRELAAEVAKWPKLKREPKK